MKKSWLVGLLLFVAVGTALLLQVGINADEIHPQTTAALSIQVTDSVGIPLNDGVTVTVQTDTLTVQTLTSRSDDGLYTAIIQPGAYSVVAHAEGYTDKTQKVNLNAGDRQALKFFLDENK